MNQPKPNNEATKNQIKKWLEESVKKAQSPDPREKLKREREMRAKHVEKSYGF
jgi:hypothetical protein